VGRGRRSPTERLAVPEPQSGLRAHARWLNSAHYPWLSVAAACSRPILFNLLCQ
jgi:hypothetical protein